MGVALLLALAACGAEGEDAAAPTSPSTSVITDSQRGVLLAEAACSVVLPGDVAAAFGRAVVSDGGRVGTCDFLLEPGLAGSSELIVKAEIYLVQPRQSFEDLLIENRIVEVFGVGVPSLYDPLLSAMWALVEPSGAVLPGRASDLGSVDVFLLNLQVLLLGVGVAPDDVREEILAGLRGLTELVAPKF